MENISLPSWADHRAEQFRPPAVGEPVDIEAVVIAGYHHVAGEGHIGVGEAQHGGRESSSSSSFFL